ncbi:hypothetical protein H6P81_016421 [Aristolochia fimbriata]|uniref:TraB domain-containing protein n=1 Tax=Aristolochia fimbriata TaxID=158543 RepID=A0AAV7EBB9_ARIFI|nr:hypothetical protein H6P81_016421 [Aristolochia fimbriata]
MNRHSSLVQSSNYGHSELIPLIPAHSRASPALTQTDMKTLPSPLLSSQIRNFPGPSFLRSSSNTLKPASVKVASISIKPPPPGFDYRKEILSDSRAAITALHPELLDLANEGSLILIQKSQFGPVPVWRTAFVEPEEIWLVGTSHISEESAKNVERVVMAVKPDRVVVELCRSRAGIMYTAHVENSPPLKSNTFSLSGPRFLGAVGRSINLGGQTALALRLLLAVFTSKISADSNRSFGDEFRSARMASEEVGAQIVLGDRPIEITLSRAWSSLKWDEKLNFVAAILRGIASPSLDTTDNHLKDQEMDGAPLQLYEQLSFSFPSLLQPLIYERDIYLAWSLKRSKAVNNVKRVVGVIGKGHLNGVIHALMADQGDLRFSDVAGRRADSSNGWIKSLIKSLVRDALVGFILWICYEQVAIFCG